MLGDIFNLLVNNTGENPTEKPDYTLFLTFCG